MQNPAWYAIIADDANDFNFNKQLNFRYVDDDYTINEDTVGLFCLPNTTAVTLSIEIKDTLTHSSLTFALCRGQAYNGASTMQEKRSGLPLVHAMRILQLCLCIYCLAHSLSLQLQDAARR